MGKKKVPDTEEQVQQEVGRSLRPRKEIYYGEPQRGQTKKQPEESGSTDNNDRNAFTPGKGKKKKKNSKANKAESARDNVPVLSRTGEQTEEQTPSTPNESRSPEDIDQTRPIPVKGKNKKKKKKAKANMVESARDNVPALSRTGEQTEEQTPPTPNESRSAKVNNHVSSNPGKRTREQLRFEIDTRESVEVDDNENSDDESGDDGSGVDGGEEDGSGDEGNLYESAEDSDYRDEDSGDEEDQSDGMSVDDFDQMTTEQPGRHSWDAISQDQRHAHLRKHAGNKEREADWDTITLRFDPDQPSKRNVQGKIRRIVIRGYLWVVLPSLNPRGMGRERAVLVRGRDYADAKQRFTANGGQTELSQNESFLSNSDWRDFKIIAVASTPNGKMTLIEGYVDKKHAGGVGVVSFSTLKAAYGTPEGQALVLYSRAQVGQARLSKKKPSLPADVMEYLAKRNLEL